MKSHAHSCRRLPILILAFALLCSGASADTTFAPGALELEEERNIAAIPGDLAEEPEEENASQGRRNREFIVAPLPSRNPLMGWTLSLPAMMLYKPASASAEDSTWITGAAAFYAENKSRGGGAFHKMSLGGDRWRLMGAAFRADLKYDYFGIGGDPDTPIPLDQSMSLFMAEALRGTYPNLYVGLRTTFSTTEVSLDLPDDLLPPGVSPPDLGREFDLATMAPRIQYDTRDNQFYPAAGSLLDGTFSIGRDSLGSDVDYERYKFEYNHYRSPWSKGVFAVRAALEYVGGDAPFFLYPAFGSGADLRGYQTGSYRDRFLFASQVEYRHRVTPRLGAVVFAGVGTVDPDFGNWGKTLGSVGAGIRWVIAPKNNMSLRLDVARGHDDTEFYVGIGEAF
jgi:outer membrane protein assembly factor BamA